MHGTPPLPPPQGPPPKIPMNMGARAAAEKAFTLRAAATVQDLADLALVAPGCTPIGSILGGPNCKIGAILGQRPG